MRGEQGEKGNGAAAGAFYTGGGRERGCGTMAKGEGGGVSAVVPHRGGRRKERGPWHSGGQFRAAGNGSRPSGAGGAMPRKQGSPGGWLVAHGHSVGWLHWLIGGPGQHNARQLRWLTGGPERHSVGFEQIPNNPNLIQTCPNLM
jgi:hypothetical protein